MDVTENCGSSKKLPVASRIKREIYIQQKLTCSVGVGPNKLVAKIAADIKKPDGLTVVPPEHVKAFLAPLPVRSLLGVGKKYEQRLESLHVKTVGQLANFDVQKLIGVFGKHLGTYLHNASQGIDDTPVQERTEPESLSRIATLKEDTRDLDTILQQAYKLCESVHGKLLNQKLVYRSVSIYIVANDLSTHSRSKTFETPTTDLQIFMSTVQELFEKFLNESDIEARRVGVRLSSLSPVAAEQKQLTSFFGA